MSRLVGIVARLKTSSSSDAGTDDHLYVGVAGKGGGREFPLDVKGFDDFERGHNIKYWFGEVWDDVDITDAKRPNMSKPGERNDPEKFKIELEDVQYVYIRKQSDHPYNIPGDDDAYKLDEVEVNLYGYSPDLRKFSASDDLWFGDEYGQQAWIPEDSRSVSIPVAVSNVKSLRRFQ